MFIVKDQNALSSLYIPQYFGHSNFSSFDRQLNFYGFRKSFPDALRQTSVSIVLTDASKESSKYVRFYHQYFKRGRTELFHLIKRANTKKRSSEKKNSKACVKKKKSEVEELREELSSLECRLTSVSSDIEQKFSQLSKDIERIIEVMRGIVSDAGSRLFGPQQNFGRVTSSNSARPLESGEGYVVERFPQSFGTSKTTAFLSAYDDFLLDSKSLSAVQQSSSKIGRLLSDDFVSLLRPSSSNLPPSPNLTFQRTTSTSSRAKSDMHDEFSMLLKKKQGLTFSRSTTEEIFNLFNNPPESISPELGPRVPHGKHHPTSLITGDNFTLLPDSSWNQSKKSNVHTKGYLAESFLDINSNPPSKTLPRSSTEDFFGVLLERQNEMNTEDTEMFSSNLQGPSELKLSNDFTNLHSLPSHHTYSKYMRSLSDEAFNALKDTAGNFSGKSVYTENQRTMYGFLGGAEPSPVPLFSIDQPNKGIDRMTTEDFFGEYLAAGNNNNQTSHNDGDEAAALLMFASQNLQRH
jgi:hypothetical protein